MTDEEKLEFCKKKRAHYSREVSRLEIELGITKGEKPVVKLEPIKFIKQKYQIGVTDHAILRYLERICGVDIEQVKKLILDVTGRKSKLSGFKIVSDGFTFVVVDFGVVTIHKAKSRHFSNFKTGKISKRDRNKINMSNSGWGVK